MLTSVLVCAVVASGSNGGKGAGPGQLVTLPFHTLEKATEGWSAEHVLGKGGYATVYRAALPRALIEATGVGRGILPPAVLAAAHTLVACKLLESDSEMRRKEEDKRRIKENTTLSPKMAKVLGAVSLIASAKAHKLMGGGA